MKRITVSLRKRSYDILIAKGLLAKTGSLLAELKVGKKIMVVSDRRVARKIGLLGVLTKSLSAAGFKVSSCELSYGTEQDKSPDGLLRLWHLMCRAGLDRQSTLVALGGGVTGDLAGFAASTYMRGIPLVHVPTTLLAQVDSAIGGKTAIDLEGAKNAVGTFYQPRLVLSDLDVLSSLPLPVFRSSFAEVIKYGVIRDPDLFELLERRGRIFLKETGKEKSLGGDVRFLEDVVYRCSKIKARIVERDEREVSGERAILNYGHTFAHALEGASRYRMLHGDAVALGMMLASRFAKRLGLCDASFAERQAALIQELCGIRPLASYAKQYQLSWPRIQPLFFRDKKTVSDSVQFILPIKLGVVKTVTAEKSDWPHVQKAFRDLGF